MLLQGLFITILGFSVVFCFLVAMVGLMYLSAAIFKRFPSPSSEGIPAGDDAAIAVAIAAAHRHCAAS